MAEHREQVDKRMMQRINRRVLTPLLIDLGARYLVKPYLGNYEDEAKTAHWGFGHKTPRRQTPPHNRCLRRHHLHGRRKEGREGIPARRRTLFRVVGKA